MFTLVVDDFAIEYITEDAQHLIEALKQYYTIPIDWDVMKYIGPMIHWDYVRWNVYINMPGYLTKTLQCFKRPTPMKQQNSLHPHVTPQYGAKVQYMPEEDQSPPLKKEDTKYIQAVVGILLYYGRAVDNKILTLLSSIVTKQAKPMQKTMEVITNC